MWFYKILLQLFQFGWAEFDNQRRHHLGKIKFDKNTKLSVLKDQLQQIINTNNYEEMNKSKKYAIEIIDDLKKDFKANQTKIALIDNIHIELKYDTINNETLNMLKDNL